jgi:hypothetical protein
MGPTTPNRRRAAGCHPCLSVPALPNVGLAAPDRPQLAWVYPELYEQAHPEDLLFVFEALSARGIIMESLGGTTLVEESLSAAPLLEQSLSAAALVEESARAAPSVQEALSAIVTINP